MTIENQIYCWISALSTAAVIAAAVILNVVKHRKKIKDRLDANTSNIGSMFDWRSVINGSLKEDSIRIGKLEDSFITATQNSAECGCKIDAAIKDIEFLIEHLNLEVKEGRRIEKLKK